MQKLGPPAIFLRLRCPPEGGRYKCLLGRWRRHINDWSLRSLRRLPVRGIRIWSVRISSIWIGAIRIGSVWSGSGIRVRICWGLPWHCNLPCRIPKELPQLVRVASQINAEGWPFDLAPYADDVAAHNS